MINPLRLASFAILATIAVAELSASPFAQSVAVGWNRHDAQAIVARGGANRSIAAYGNGGSELLWSASGPAEPALVVVSNDGSRSVVLDTINDLAFLIATKDGTQRRISTAASPVAAVFYGNELFILCRDGRELQRVSADGNVKTLAVAPDTTFMRKGKDAIYVYSRLEGTVTEVDPSSLTAVRTQVFASAASDLEIDGRSGYLTIPSAGVVIVFSLAELKERERLSVGTIPLDLSVVSDGGVLDAGSLAVADPSSRRVWMSEKSQSGAAAFGRGFLRGLIGLGLYAPRSSEYPTGVDRVWAETWGLAAYDSSSGTLYLVSKGKATKVASDVPAGAIALTGRGVTWWNSATNRLELAEIRH